jgi:polyisoprenoid-binding protein YceI
MSKSTPTSEPASIAIDRPNPSPTGTWTIDPRQSSVTFTWRRLRLWTITGRLHGLGVIHLDDLPPVGVIRFQQPSGLPVLTMALDPASEAGEIGLDTLLCGADVSDVRRHRWWTLRSESLEVLPDGTWRVTVTLTANGTPGLVELRFEVDAEANDRDGLVLTGRGVLDRRAFGMDKASSILISQVRLDLAVRARRVVTDTSTEAQQEEKVTCTTSMPG